MALRSAPFKSSRAWMAFFEAVGKEVHVHLLCQPEGLLSTPSVAASRLLLGFALRDSAAAPRGRGGAQEAGRSRVGPPESVAPAAPSDPEQR